MGLPSSSPTSAMRNALASAAPPELPGMPASIARSCPARSARSSAEPSLIAPTTEPASLLIVAVILSFSSVIGGLSLSCEQAYPAPARLLHALVLCEPDYERVVLVVELDVS